MEQHSYIVTVQVITPAKNVITKLVHVATENRDTARAYAALLQTNESDTSSIKWKDKFEFEDLSGFTFKATSVLMVDEQDVATVAQYTGCSVMNIEDYVILVDSGWPEDT